MNIICPKTLAESVQGFLFEHVKWGWEETELNHEINFTVYFANTVRANEFTALIKSKFPPLKLKLQQEENQDWTENWKQFFTPIKILNKFIILPSWEKNNHPDLIPIYIEPKMAFGTGHHESTQLALMLMEEFLKPGMRVLDVGTGSGILTIYAAQKGASFVLGIDNDAVSIENAMENAALNGVAEKIIFRIRDAREFYHPDFDLVVANINRNVLLEITAGLQKALKPSGILILSGILKQDRPVMLEALKAFPLEQVAEKTKNEWLGLAFKKKAVH